MTATDTTSPSTEKSPEPEAKGSEKGAETSEVKAQGKQQATSEDQSKSDGGELLTGDDQPSEGESSAPEGAPEAYDFTAPEGEQWSPEVLGVYGEAARELNLTNDKAQKLLDTMAPAIAKAYAEAVQAQNQRYWDEWKAAAEKDETIGGKDFKANVNTAKKALKRFGDAELGELLKVTGLTNHPAILRWAFKVGREISEDGVLTGSQPRKREVDRNSPAAISDRMFPSMRKK